MSHFFVIVLLPGTTMPAAIAAAVEKSLAPYDENLKVAVYDRRCYCVGTKARNASALKAETDHPMLALRERFQRDNSAAIERRNSLEWSSTKPTPAEREEYRALDDSLVASWKAAMAPREAVAAATFTSRDDRETPDRSCDECGGNGTIRSRSNPRGYWDWFRIGGRWDGAIKGIEVESKDNGFNFGDEHTSVGRNATPAIELPIPLGDRCPFALVTPDGEWHQRGKMGWFASVSDEMTPEQWGARADELVATNRDAIAVGVDCHV